ncbi:helix-turn-helix domain-containing protein [Streptomyces aurantiogriseus]|uniref:AraC family transcriptional regulator n=1 Tax=Streptomyces aurantiogriseus TaxID=66870 RepID=A0A918F8M0_9ACTN|nr:helix-turn-helix domain-containing protein [Streptomyces aurantiogriseus]GGR10778.1 AraC family transcriptional regulator [Streptomyces aurantiogriseus]
MNLVLTTASVPDGEKLAYWRDALSTALVPMTVATRGDGPFSGRISTARLGHLRVSAIEADPQRTSRTPRHIAQAPADYIAIGVQTAGTATLVQDGRHAGASEGDLVVYDTTRPYSLDYPEPFSTRIVRMPRRAVGLPEEDLRRVTGTAISATEGFAALLVSFLTALTTSVPACSPSVAARLADGVVDLFATLVEERTRGRGEQAAGAHKHLVLRIRDHIDRNLGDPALTPQTVAAAHHISVRYLHRLFEGEGITVARLIQQRRLHECARELGRPDAPTRTVSAVAQRWGFANPAHFSRVFRAAYGRSPREWVRAGSFT